MRVIFFGTPDIAATVLTALAHSATVCAVVCQPDRPAGRGLTLKPPAVKVRALELGLEVVQPSKVRGQAFEHWMVEQRADVALVIAYGRILPQRVLDTPRRGCMNLHASLLPHYRGAAPINWAIARGETQTGISLMQMDRGCDTGPVFCQRTISIDPDETAGQLYQRLAKLAAQVTREDFPRAVAGELTAAPQDHENASHAPIMKKQDGSVDFNRTEQEVYDHIRGMTPWPGAHSTLGGKRFRLLEARLADAAVGSGPPGTIVKADKEGVFIACQTGALELLRGQRAGKKALSSSQLANGRQLTTGMRFGD